MAVFHVVRQTDYGDLRARLFDYENRIEQLSSPNEVLEELNAITTSCLALSVLGAARLPMKSGDWESIQLGKSVFLHKNVPEGWWEEFWAVARGNFRPFRPMLFLAQSCMASYTTTEARRMFQPIGVDQSTYEVCLKWGIRDVLTCPVGGRWVVAFWSRKDLSKVLTRPLRIVIVSAADFVALRLEQLIGPDPTRVGTRGHLTPRELAVLRLIAEGAQSHDAAKALGLGEETVRSHLKKAQTKLGARNRTQAVAEALRQNLLP